MSFRARLNLFFVLLVVVPLFAVGVVLLRTLDGAALGRTESALASEARAVSTVNGEIREQAGVTSREIAGDRKLAAALRADDVPAVRARARQLLTPTTPARRIRIAIARGGKVVDVGDQNALLPQRNALVSPGPDQRPLGELEVAIIGPTASSSASTSSPAARSRSATPRTAACSRAPARGRASRRRPDGSGAPTTAPGRR